MTPNPNPSPELPKDQGCKVPPDGWWCSREQGHEGPCAAREAGTWIIGNGNGDRWRTWHDGWSAWTDNRDQATRYPNRTVAEIVHADDEDAWRVEFVPTLSQTLPAPGKVDADEFETVETWEHDDQRELSLLYNHAAHDRPQFNRIQMRQAIRHGKSLATVAAANDEAVAVDAAISAMGWTAEHMIADARKIAAGVRFETYGFGGDCCLTGPQVASFRSCLDGAVAAIRLLSQGAEEA